MIIILQLITCHMTRLKLCIGYSRNEAKSGIGFQKIDNVKQRTEGVCNVMSSIQQDSLPA